jgi:tRNA(adenine34) deaminase
VPDDVAHPGDPAHPGEGPASGATAADGTPEPRGLDLPWADGTFPPGTVARRHQVWDALMGLALHEATHALASDDVPVGALVVGPDGRLLGVGRNRREETGDPTAHAEVLALRQAAATLGEWRLEGCTLVVTLEPCVMCAGALVLARVERLVLGAWDPKAGATGSVWDLVRDQRANHAVEVIGGVREDECGRLLRDFFAAQR